MMTMMMKIIDDEDNCDKNDNDDLPGVWRGRVPKDPRVPR